MKPAWDASFQTGEFQCHYCGVVKKPGATIDPEHRPDCPTRNRCAVCLKPGYAYFRNIPLKWKDLVIRVDFALCEEHNRDLLAGTDNSESPDAEKEGEGQN